MSMILDILVAIDTNIVTRDSLLPMVCAHGTFYANLPIGTFQLMHIAETGLFIKATAQFCLLTVRSNGFSLIATEAPIGVQ
jgi:hypothetical protein